MNLKWLNKNGKSRLVLFCNGWGMDENPFQPLKVYDYDLLMIYDYHDFESSIAIDQIFEPYEEVILIGWSMGVWVGQLLFGEYGDRLTDAIAINGTLAPIDDQCGIPRQIFKQTYTDFNEQTRLNFYRRMCRDKKILSRFLVHQPVRSLQSQRLELDSFLQDCQNIPVENSIYSQVIVALKDFVMPTSHQLHFWPKNSIHKLDGYHFLFYGWHSWDGMIEEIIIR